MVLSYHCLKAWQFKNVDLRTFLDFKTKTKAFQDLWMVFSTTVHLKRIFEQNVKKKTCYRFLPFKLSLCLGILVWPPYTISCANEQQNSTNLTHCATGRAERCKMKVERTCNYSWRGNYCCTKFNRISWFVKLEQINYLPKWPKVEANNWSARQWDTTTFCDNIGAWL